MRKPWPKNNGSVTAEGREEDHFHAAGHNSRGAEAEKRGRHAGGGRSGVGRVGRSTAEVPLESHEMFEHELSDQNLI